MSLKTVSASGAEQIGHHGLHAFQRVAHGARLLEDFLLHVVAVGAELGRAAVRVHGAHRALHALEAVVGRARADPPAAQLQIDQVVLFQVDDLVGHAGQGHGVGGEEGLVLAHAQHQRGAGARTDDAVRLVAAEHGQRIGAVQAGQGLLHGFEQVAVVQRIDQVGDDLGVGLAQLNW